MVSETSIFKERPVISLKKDEDDRFPFSFGIAKAKLIVSNIDAIRKFVDDNTTDEMG